MLKRRFDSSGWISHNRPVILSPTWVMKQPYIIAAPLKAYQISSEFSFLLLPREVAKNVKRVPAKNHFREGGDCSPLPALLSQ